MHAKFIARQCFSLLEFVMAAGLMDIEVGKDRLTSVLVTDFCPWANRYVYWLKEPIGWFVIAFAISILVGLHISTVGWVLASVLGSVMGIGIVWPWIVVRAAYCELRPALSEVHEGQACDLVLAVRNRMPFPLWGLAIEGYLDRQGDDLQPTIALACVPLASDAEYRLKVSPALRGLYPVRPPKIACSMPFGLWTARRSLRSCAPLTVFPAISRIQDDPQWVGGRQSETGEGMRVGEAGEPLGVREFRSGDRLRNVHWIHTARTGTLTVCERGGPQQQQFEIVLDMSSPATADPDRRLWLREALARRVRVAASIAVALHGHHVPLRLVIGDQVVMIGSGSGGRRRLLTVLAEVPADGIEAQGDSLSGNTGLRPGNQRATVLVGGSATGNVSITFDRQLARPDSRSGHSLSAGEVVIMPGHSLDLQLARFWRDVNHVRNAG